MSRPDPKKKKVLRTRSSDSSSLAHDYLRQIRKAPMNKDKLQTLARDLRKTAPRSPRETLGGFVITARMLDKARADLLGSNGEYNFYPCGLGAYFWKFTGLDAPKFKEFVATGATDERSGSLGAGERHPERYESDHPLEQRNAWLAAGRSVRGSAGIFRGLRPAVL